MEEQRKSFIFYRSFSECLISLEDSERLKMYEAITSYALDSVEPKLTGCLKGMFALIRPQLDANIKRWKNGYKGAEYGFKGGRPKTETPNKPLKNPTETPNYNHNLNHNDNENENCIGKKQVFQKPTLTEIKNYISEKHFKTDAERFFDFYESKDWFIGKNKMRDWRAAVRTWERSDSTKKQVSQTDFSGDYSKTF